MSKKTNTTQKKTGEPKAARKATTKRVRKRRQLPPDEQIFRDNPYERDTPEYRRYVVAAVYTLMEQQHREVPDYAADVMQRYAEFKLSMAEVVSRIDFAVKNLR
jgi:hypothetical protein